MLKHHNRRHRHRQQQPPLSRSIRSVTAFLFGLTTFLTSTTTTTTTRMMAHAQSLGIPGTTQTISGYDTEFGRDAICWSSFQATSSSSSKDNTHDHAIDLPNPLIEGFHIDATGVTLLRACPVGNTLQGTAPTEFLAGERLRTGVWYNYSVQAQLNLTALIGDSGGTTATPTVVADNGTFVSIQILLCVLGASGFCHPFVHEEANERLIRDDGVLETVPIGDRHGQSHVHSPYYLVELNITTATSEQQQEQEQQDLSTAAAAAAAVYHIDVQVPMLVNRPGDFFAVTAMQLYVPKEEDENNNTTEGTTTTRLWRYDMANALEQRVLSYQDPATILKVPNGIRYLSYCAIAIVASVILFLFHQTYKHVNHQVLQLTQGYFLLLFLWAALVATVSSFLVEPKNDAYCQAENFILLIHMQLMYAIIVGRLWRIHSVISPLLVQTLKRREGSGGVMLLRMRRWLGLRGTSATNDGAESANASSLSSSSSSGPLRRGSSRWSKYMGSTSAQDMRRRSSSLNRPKQLRKQVTAWQLSIVIAVFTLPQVVLQILSLALQPMERTLDMNEDESKGRVICSDDVSLGASLNFYGYLCFCCLILVLLFMAYSTRSLPSLFNETRVIFDLTVTTMALLIVGMVIIIATDSPTTSPVIRYIVKIGIILSTTLNTTTRIMMPKLRLVWNGEKVIVSQLVSDHNKSMRRQGHPSSSPSRSPAVYDPNSLQAPGEIKQQKQSLKRVTSNTSSARSNSQQIFDEMDDFVNGVSENDNAKQSLNEQDDITTGEDCPVEIDIRQKGVSESVGTTAFIDEERAQQQQLQPHNESMDLLPPEPTLKNVNMQSAARQSTVRFVDSLDNNNTPAAAASRHGHQHHHAVVIKQDEAPSRRLILKMLNLQEQLSRVNERIISGMTVPEDDWEAVRRLNRKLATAFSEDVEFEWEQLQQGDKEGKSSSDMIQTVSA